MRGFLGGSRSGEDATMTTKIWILCVLCFALGMLTITALVIRL